MDDYTSENPNGWKYPAFDGKGKVYCQECGKTFMILTPSHLKTHGLKYGEYKEKYPDAPITNEEFKALSKYSRPSKYTKEDIEILGKEKIVDDDIPVIDDEFELPKIESVKKFSNPIEQKKHEIFVFLSNYLPSVKMDYLIEIKNIHQDLIFSTISDFSDPVLKINIEFPRTFWHNYDASFIHPGRKKTLEEHGWKVIEIDSLAPSTKEIGEAIQKVMR
jgi:hypothetical protein